MKSYGHFVKNGDTVQLKCTVVEKTTTERPTIVFQSIGVNPPEVTNTVDWYIGIGSDPVGPPSVSLGISCGASTVSAPGSVTCTSTVSPAQGSPVAGGFWIITLPSGSMVQMGNCDNKTTCTFSFAAGSQGVHRIQGVGLDAGSHEVTRSNTVEVSVQ
jgi:hypothetical protein